MEAEFCPTVDCGEPIIVNATSKFCMRCGYTVEHCIFGDRIKMSDQHKLIMTHQGSHIVNVTPKTRAEVIRESFQRYLGKTSAVIIPAPIIERAVRIILDVQQISFQNRSDILKNMMAGALYIAILEAKITITETQIAKIFLTNGGISKGKNLVMGLLVAAYMKKTITEEPKYMYKNPQELLSIFIRAQMSNVGIDFTGERKKIYYFIKCLANIEELFASFDPQTPKAKIAGAIFYYLNYSVGAPVIETTVLREKLQISQETLAKYSKKLGVSERCGHIQRIADILKVPLRGASNLPEAP